MHTQVCALHRCFDISVHKFRTHSLQVVQMRSCMRSLFIGVGGRGWGGRANVWMIIAFVVTLGEIM